MSTIQPIAAELEPHPDVALVERVRGGDVSAYDELVRKYERQIFRISQHITQNREDAEDVMQDAFLKAYEKLDQFQGNSKFYTWLVRIAVNESLMRLRKRRTGEIRLDRRGRRDRRGQRPTRPGRLGSQPRAELHAGRDGENPGKNHQRAAGGLPSGVRTARRAGAVHRRYGRGAWAECSRREISTAEGKVAASRALSRYFRRKKSPRKSGAKEPPAAKEMRAEQ